MPPVELLVEVPTGAKALTDARAAYLKEGGVPLPHRPPTDPVLVAEGTVIGTAERIGCPHGGGATWAAGYSRL